MRRVCVALVLFTTDSNDGDGDGGDDRWCMYVAGVFNGNFSKSVRARVPSTNAITITNSLHTGSALDIRKGKLCVQ